MKCPRCQHENPTGMKFCGQCTAPLASTCGSCGATNPPENKFCGQCAAPLLPAPATKNAAPDSYTPKHLAEKILTSRAALEGERKQVTVLFADLKGSMELLADRDPEEARKLLDPVLTLMMDAVHRYEGTVNQVMGDGIMALFGAPIAHEDHAVRACYAALRMQESLKRYADEVRHSQGVTIRIRVGLNSGEVVVRSVGSDLHMDYTAVGQTTHLAGRMEQLADPGASLLTAETLRRAEGYVEVKPLGPVPVKGLAGAVDVYELLGAWPVRSRLHAAAARGLSRFVGRDTELAQLRQALELGGGGQGQLVAVVGEPGVGKSRLYWEFTHSPRSTDWLILEANSVSYGQATAYLPVIDLLKRYFQIEAGDDGRRIREKVTGKLLALDRQLEPWLPALLALLDIPFDDPGWERLDPPQRRQRVLDGVKQLFLRESQVQPLLILVEDLHWIDSETQALLDGLIESLPSARLLLLVSYRPEYQHGWAGKTYYRQLHLDPLPSESAADLLASLLGLHPSLEPLKRLLTERAEGNPLFLEESVSALVETGVLIGARGAHRLARDVTGILVPATVQALLAARIDRLGPEDKRLLQAAAVIGKDVPLALLQAVADLPNDSLTHGLARLQAAEFLYEIRLFPDIEYTFKHALTHEVAYGALLQDRRRALHVRIVEAMERLYPNRPAEQLERLAHHAFAGEAWARAVSYLREAGARASSRSLYRDAVVRFGQALAALANLPESVQTRQDQIDLHLATWTALWPLGELDPVLTHLNEAERLAQSIGDEPRLGWVFAHLSYFSLIAGAVRDATPYAERAGQIAERLDDAGLKLAATCCLADSLMFAGDHQRLDALVSQVLHVPPGDLWKEHFGITAYYPAAMLRGQWAASLALRGEFAAAFAQGGEALRLAEAVDHPFTLAVVCWALSIAYEIRGRFEDAISLAQRGLVVCRERHVPFLVPFLQGRLAASIALAGDIAEGQRLLREAQEAAQAIHSGAVGRGLFLTAVQMALLAGEVDRALPMATAALNHSRETGLRDVEAITLQLLAEITAAGPDAASAECCYDAAIALAGELGLRPIVAHCHLGLGKLCRGTGKREVAHEHLTTAITMYREMDMPFWLEKAGTEMREFP